MDPNDTSPDTPAETSAPEPQHQPSQEPAAAPSAAPQPNPALSQEPSEPPAAAEAAEPGPQGPQAPPQSPPNGPAGPSARHRTLPQPQIPSGVHPGAAAAAGGQPMPHPTAAPNPAPQAQAPAPGPHPSMGMSHPDGAAQQATAEQIQQQQMMQRMMEEAQASQLRVQPWVQLLIQKLSAGDPIAQDLVTDMAHCSAQLTRYIADELRRAGHGETAMAAFQGQTFGEIFHAFLQQPMALVSQSPGPAYWLDYMNGHVVSDLGAREERIAAQTQVMQEMRTPNPAQPQAQPGPQTPPRDDGRAATFSMSNKPGRKPRTPGTSNTPLG